MKAKVRLEHAVDAERAVVLGLRVAVSR